MEGRRASLLAPALIVLIMLAIGGLYWANTRVAERAPAGSSFLTGWAGARAFLTQRASPYSDEVASQVQQIVYGREARRGEERFTFLYPFYTVFVFLPFAMIKDPGTARLAWMTFLEVMLFGMAGFSVAASGWHIRRGMLFWVGMFALLWFYSLHPLLLGDISILVGALVAAALYAIRGEHDVWAGFLLALATVKPTAVVLLIPLLVIWGVSQRRWLLVSSTLGWLALMVAGTLILMPDWLYQNFRNVVIWLTTSLPGSPGGLFYRYLPGIGKEMGWGLTIVMIATLIYEWRGTLGKDFSWLYWTACLTLVITNLAGVRTSIDNYVVMLPGFLLTLAVWQVRWGRLGRGLIATSLLVNFALFWYLALWVERTGRILTINPYLFLLPLAFMFIGLYWVRWQALRPLRLPFEDLSRV